MPDPAPEVRELFHVVLRADPVAAARATAHDCAQPLRVLLLHGWLQDCTCWLRCGGALSRAGHDVLLVDWPRHGHSPTADELGVQNSADGFLDALLMLIDSVGWECGPPLAVAGVSLGAALAMRFAVARPERVARLTLVAPAGLHEPACNVAFHVVAPLVGMLPHPLAHLTRGTPTYGLTIDGITALAGRLGPDGAMHVVVGGCDLVHTPHVAFWGSLLPPHGVRLLPWTSHWWLCTHLHALRLHERPQCWGREAAATLASRL